MPSRRKINTGTRGKRNTEAVPSDWYIGPPCDKERWEQTIRAIPKYDAIATRGAAVFHADDAQRTIDFFEQCLQHVKGELAGRPFLLERWERAIIANLFGWKRPDGTRRYRYVLIFVPRKNGKSSLAAGLVLLVLVTDREPGAEIYGAAGSRDQARCIFDVAAAMVRAEPELSARLRVFRNAITYEVAGRSPSGYKMMSSEAGLQHGLNIHCAVVDELHVQGSDELVDVIETGTGARRQPIVVYITTAGYDRESVCYEKYQYFRKIRDGILNDPSYLPVIYEADEDDDWQDEATWAKANPNLGVSLSIDYLREQFARAKELPRYQNTVRRLHLNQWTEQSCRWLDVATWDAAAGPVGWRELREQLRGRRCFAGVDLSSINDLTSCALVFPPQDESTTWHVLQWSWLPRDSAEERGGHGRKRREAPYLEWARLGLLILTEGASVDYRAIRNHINRLRQEYDIVELGYDPYNAEYLCNQQLGQEDGLRTIAVRQGMLSMSPPSKFLESLVLDKCLMHGGDPLLRWAITNVAVRQDPNENLMPDKQRSQQRIDPVVATIVALSRAIVSPSQQRSVYEDRGLL